MESYVADFIDVQIAKKKKKNQKKRTTNAASAACSHVRPLVASFKQGFKALRSNRKI
jgi:hypothetical protein